MASIHKDPRGKSPYWYAAYTDAHGNRRFRSTKQADRKAALKVCAGYERAADLARKGILTQSQALKVVNEIYEQASGETLLNATAKAYFQDWMDSRRLSTAPGTARRYGDVLKSFVGHLGDKANLSVTAITPPDVQRFRDAYVKAGKANKTANMAVKTLRIALNTAKRQGMLLSNPAEAVESLPEDSVGRKPFTREQIEALLAVADAEWRGMILIGACHGLRITDAAMLKWENIDSERRSIRFKPQKRRRSITAKEVEVPLHRDVEDYLSSLPVRSNKPDAPIFPKLSCKRAGGRNGLSETFVALMEKAGIFREPGIDKVRGEGRQVHKLSYHSFRHTAISEMANAGVSKERRMKLTDHKSNVHERYTHHELETLRKDVEQVKSFLKK